ncbi:MAG: OadG family protein [Bacteroidales bacterium]
MKLLQVSFDLSAIDTGALTLAIIGYLVVFAALVLLYFVFYYFPRIIKTRRIRRDNEKGLEPEVGELTGEVNAAIGMALHFYLEELHDEESNVVTIRRTSKAYSPWSSKIYGVRNYFNRI